MALWLKVMVPEKDTAQWPTESELSWTAVDGNPVFPVHRLQLLGNIPRAIRTAVVYDDDFVV